ncbi:MAG: MOSC domain-containing protein [Gammaproteobacteria bacterium]
MQKLAELKKHFPYPGKVEWIGIRPNKGSAIEQKSYIEAMTDHGLDGDKAGQRPGGKRQVTLFQAEYIDVIRSLMPNKELKFVDLRRNIAVSGINLNALKDCSISLGEATLEITGFCHPCSKLEAQLGEGVFNALRGHGGLTAKVIKGGVIHVGDDLHVLSVD